jgi:hypothetical protein
MSSNTCPAIEAADAVLTARTRRPAAAPAAGPHFTLL